ncbi:MAG: GDSL-type esterase/lipase family protein [Clostridia bacterium]
MKVICLGDSLTYGFGVLRNQVWTTLSAEQTGFEIINAGINGDTTSGMLARFAQDVAQPHSDTVLIMGGINDHIAGCPAGVMQSNVMAMVQQASALGIQPIIGLPIPVCTELLPPNWASLWRLRGADAELSTYLNWLPIFAQAFSIPLIDFRQPFFAAAQSTLSQLYLDGIHPTPFGHKLMAKTFISSILML